MLRLCVYWLLCLPLAFAMVMTPAAAADYHQADASCPIQHEPSVELMSTLDVEFVADDMQDDNGGTAGCVTSCINLSGGASPTSKLLPPSSEALHAPVVVWVSTSPERLERPPRV